MQRLATFMTAVLLAAGLLADSKSKLLMAQDVNNSQRETTAVEGGSPRGGIVQFDRDQRVVPDVTATAEESDRSDAGDADTIKALQQRVEKLEAKVDILQSLLFRTVRLDQLAALDRYKKAKALYENSEKLRIQGLITAIQVDQDRFTLEKAKLEYILSRLQGDPSNVSVQIDLIQARSDLLVSQQQLQISEQQLARGLASPQEITRRKREVQDREREVEFQKKRLEDVRKLGGMEEPADNIEEDRNQGLKSEGSAGGSSSSDSIEEPAVSASQDRSQSKK